MTLEVLEAWSGVVGFPEVRELKADRVWELATSSGRRYALKQVWDTAGQDPVRHFSSQARILSYLGQRGLPVAVPVLTDTGCVHAADDEGRIYGLTPMLPFDFSHRGILDDAGLYEHTGETLARLHLALAECPYRIDSWEVTPEVFETRYRELETGLPAELFAEIAVRTEPWRSRIEQALADPHRQHIHGDAHGANILTDGRVVTGIIDVDKLPVAPRSFELGYYLAFWMHWALGQDTEQAVAEGGPFITRHLLRGYDRVSPLTASEMAAMPALALDVTLSLVAYNLRDFDQIEQTWVRSALWLADHPAVLAYST